MLADAVDEGFDDDAVDRLRGKTLALKLVVVMGEHAVRNRAAGDRGDVADAAQEASVGDEAQDA